MDANEELWRTARLVLAQAVPLSVSELLTNPDRFKGQRVTISGTMNDLQGSTWHWGILAATPSTSVTTTRPSTSSSLRSRRISRCCDGGGHFSNEITAGM